VGIPIFGSELDKVGVLDVNLTATWRFESFPYSMKKAAARLLFSYTTFSWYISLFLFLYGTEV
jgi:hypothetical protein